MVDVSHLPYRMLCRNHGAQLCFTPMLNSSRFASQPQYRAANFVVVPEDRPLIVQFCGDDPQTLLAGLNALKISFFILHSPFLFLSAARFVENDCDAVDLNLGCPQGIARKGHYGAYLLEEVDLVASIVQNLVENLSIPVTVKVSLVGLIAWLVGWINEFDVI